MPAQPRSRHSTAAEGRSRKSFCVTHSSSTTRVAQPSISRRVQAVVTATCHRSHQASNSVGRFSPRKRGSYQPKRSGPPIRGSAPPLGPDRFATRVEGDRASEAWESARHKGEGVPERARPALVIVQLEHGAVDAMDSGPGVSVRIPGRRRGGSTHGPGCRTVETRHPPASSVVLSRPLSRCRFTAVSSTSTTSLKLAYRCQSVHRLPIALMLGEWGDRLTGRMRHAPGSRPRSAPSEPGPRPTRCTPPTIRA